MLILSALSSCFGNTLNTDQLHNDPVWHALLHYKPTVLKLGVSSQVVSPSFFLAPDGYKNPHSELVYTIQSLKSDQSVACRFPARYLWLKTKGLKIEKPNCPDGFIWQDLAKAPNIELIFVSGYFKSPASFYGHILLRLKPKAQPYLHDLLTDTINFGAVVPREDNAFKFAFKGIFGLYPGIFTSNYYIFTDYQYAEEELRDAWSYELVLPPEKRAFLVAHIHELKNQSFRYYFFDKNCAYYVADLLQLIVDFPLLNYKLPWSMPRSIVDALASHPKSVSKITHLPSRQRLFIQKYNQLTPNSQKVIQLIAKHSFRLDFFEYQQLTVVEKAQIMDCLIDYMAVHKDVSDVHKRQIYLERIKYSDSMPTWNFQSMAYPHQSQKPTRVSLGARYYDASFDTWLQIRPAYYDLLSFFSDNPLYSELEMGTVDILYHDASIQLDHLQIFKLKQLGVSPIRMEYSWTAGLGFGSRYKYEFANLLTFKGGIGRGAIKYNNWIGYLLANGRIHYYKRHISIAPSLEVSLLYTPLPWFSMQTSSEYVFPSHVYFNGQVITTIEARLGNRNDRDYRIQYQRDVKSEIRVWTGLYF